MGQKIALSTYSLLLCSVDGAFFGHLFVFQLLWVMKISHENMSNDRLRLSDCSRGPPVSGDGMEF